ncbi:hypothetical protein Taro_031755, partial [Colocasia esculenta]|nr:hypothetical protein [Colocasia esculenta]
MTFLSARYCYVKSASSVIFETVCGSLLIEKRTVDHTREDPFTLIVKGNRGEEEVFGAPVQIKFAIYTQHGKYPMRGCRGRRRQGVGALRAGVNNSSSGDGRGESSTAATGACEQQQYNGGGSSSSSARTKEADAIGSENVTGGDHGRRRRRRVKGVEDRAGAMRRKQAAPWGGVQSTAERRAGLQRGDVQGSNSGSAHEQAGATADDTAEMAGIFPALIPVKETDGEEDGFGAPVQIKFTMCTQH